MHLLNNPSMSIICRLNLSVQNWILNLEYKIFGSAMHSLHSHIFLLCILFTLTACGKITIGCTSNSSCQSGYGFSYSNSTHSDFECTDDICLKDIKINYDIKKCKQDILGQNCNAGWCLFQDLIHMCFDKKNRCPQQFSVLGKCGRCQDNYCQSGLCLKALGLEQCSDECYYDSLITTLQNCKNNQDFFGNKCGCCMEVSQLKGSEVGICLDDPYYNEDLIKKYQNSTAYAGDKKKAEPKVYNSPFQAFLDYLFSS